MSSKRTLYSSIYPETLAVHAGFRGDPSARSVAVPIHQTTSYLFDDATRCRFGEALPNPNLMPFPIAEVAALGQTSGIPLIVDNTCAPLICRPFDHGAAIIVHSLTKYFCSSNLGGMIIDGRRFDWGANPARNPTLCLPGASYHNLVWTKSHGNQPNFSPFIQRPRFCLLRNVDCSLSPLNAFPILQGTETPPLRLRAHTDNARKVAQHLSKHTTVSKVNHPSLFQGLHAEHANKYLRDRGSGLLSGSASRVVRPPGVPSSTPLSCSSTLVSNIGDTRSLATMPEITTHSQHPTISHRHRTYRRHPRRSRAGLGQITQTL
ncbi:MAG: O-acetylhomoserine aminocarboxypropyltransferase/cysteine synthase [Alphaproteobacteria bacterium]|nr:O-acetylhomoserine aminocarboxypropyltransferase/cysteine synthase [Alphaproteobacteria bacterium]